MSFLEPKLIFPEEKNVSPFSFSMIFHSITSPNFVSKRLATNSFFFRNQKPRTYRRRLYEAALAPELPKKLEKEWKALNDPFNIHSVGAEEQLGQREFTPYELAFVEKLRNWIKEEKFRLVAICHIGFTKEENLWMAKNQFRLNELELCDAPSKIVKKLFSATPFRTLNPQLVDKCSCLVFGRGPESIAAVISQCTRFNWISPLSITFDDRILSLEHAKELASANALDRLRFQTAQTLSLVSQQVPSSIGSFLEELPCNLDIYQKQRQDAQRE